MYNELIDALRRLYTVQDTDNIEDWVYGSQQAMCDAADALEAAEKRIAELEAQMPKDGEWLDEQRGRWIYAKCNLCGKVQDVRSNYCPNCGAKMDGGRKDGEHERTD